MIQLKEYYLYTFTNYKKIKNKKSNKKQNYFRFPVLAFLAAFFGAFGEQQEHASSFFLPKTLFKSFFIIHKLTLEPF